jgi:hypothetical protein
MVLTTCRACSLATAITSKVLRSVQLAVETSGCLLDDPFSLASFSAYNDSSRDGVVCHIWVGYVKASIGNRLSWPSVYLRFPPYAESKAALWSLVHLLEIPEEVL